MVDIYKYLKKQLQNKNKISRIDELLERQEKVIENNRKIRREFEKMLQNQSIPFAWK